MKNIHLETILSDSFSTLSESLQTYSYADFFLSMIHLMLSYTNRIANILLYYFLLKTYRLDMGKSFDFFLVKPRHIIFIAIYHICYDISFYNLLLQPMLFRECFSLAQYTIKIETEKTKTES